MLEEYSPILIEENEKEAIYSDFEISNEIKNVLETRGIKKFYKFQKESIEKILEGKNILVMAPTAAGKTECYLIPIIIAAQKGKRSLLIYPTKALAADQFNRFKEFTLFGIRTEIYDGDTPQHIREKIRTDPPHCLITNFDMLHFILLHNRLWKDFFSKIKYVVIDEVHTYSGIFGCHIANVIWRLERVIKNNLNKEDVQYVLSSATIGNPADFCQSLFGQKKFEVIEAIGAPKAKLLHYIVNYPDESPITTAIKIAKEINKKTIIFGNSHSVVERISYYSSEFDFPIEAYRAGLTPQKRKEIEKKFSEGKINCIAATSALELGVDIKDAEVCILAGFPGSVTKTKQRIGRVGRKGQNSYVVFVAKQSPLDQYYATNPKEYLNGIPENCYANKYNEAIREIHLVCAAKDEPLKKEELEEEDEVLIKNTIEKEYLKEFKNYYFPTKKGNALARTLSLRGTNNKIQIYDTKERKIIGEREFGLAIGELYQEAIYLLGGKKYLVKNLNLEKKVAYVEEIKEDEPVYTQAYKRRDIEIIKKITEQRVLDLKIEYGKLYIRNKVESYALKNIYNNQILGKYELANPLEYNYNTYGFWVDLSKYCPFTNEYLDGLHALEHITIAMMGGISGIEPNEIGGISYPTGTIIYYEGIEGGTGACLPIIKKYDQCLKMALDRMKKCDCIGGCPKCVFSPQCGNDNEYLNKEKAIEIVKKILKIK
ncbi:MAG: DEAD/DEAH box helicase [Candidatus Anstonellaceae archaeon]